ncbi:hypothetical protein PybrP1_009172 [[Pythium] brassicae (nom. inval.)]|nr:hypothetical protein PybrP1_009172 [[Pythium] brassicae (nom. inval.)]
MLAKTTSTKEFEKILHSNTRFRWAKDSPVPPPDEADARLVSELLAGLDQSYLEAEAVFEANGLARAAGNTRIDAVVRPDERFGIQLEVFANKVLPFDMRSAGSVAWNHYAHSRDRLPNRAYRRNAPQTMNAAEDTIIEDFNLEIDLNNSNAWYRGRLAMRRYVEKKRIVIVWREYFDTLLIANQPVDGVRFLERGYVVLREPPARPCDHQQQQQSPGPSSSSPGIALQICYLASPVTTGNLAEANAFVAASDDGETLDALLAPDDDDDASGAIVVHSSAASPTSGSAAYPQPPSLGLSVAAAGVESAESEQRTRQDAAYETDHSSSSGSASPGGGSSPAAATTATPPEQQAAEEEQQRLRAIRLGKRQRQRQRQRDELKYLGFHVLELEAELSRLRAHHTEFTAQTLATARRLALLPASTEPTALALPDVWRRAATYEREALQTAIMENTRLRAQYECQLQIANGLKRLYEHQGHLAVLDASPDSGFLPKRPRVNSAVAETSDDALIFASLRHGLDAQFAQTDAVLAQARLMDFDGELTDEMILRKDARGALFFDNLYSKVFPFDVSAVSQVLWQTLTVEKLQSFHRQYLCLRNTDSEADTKAINTIALPNGAEVTLVVRIATKRFADGDRSVSVWSGVVEARGAVNVRLRETGWNVVRPARALRPGEKGPVSIEQACVQITPEPQHADTEVTLGSGTLLNLLIASYHRHMEMVHFVADDLLAMEFESISLAD